VSAAVRTLHLFLEAGDDPKALCIALETAMPTHQVVEGSLPVVSERRMSDVVEQGGRRAHAQVDAMPGSSKLRILPVQSRRDSLGDLRDLERVRQSVSEEVGLVAREDLRLSLQAPEAWRVNRTAVVAVERRAISKFGFGATKPTMVTVPVQRRH
jgi:hypothetical protein